MLGSQLLFPSEARTMSAPAPNLQRIFPREYSALVPPSETYIKHGLVSKQDANNKRTDVVMLLTDAAYYEFDPSTHELQLRSELKDVKRVGVLVDQSLLRLELALPQAATPKVKLDSWGSGDAVLSYFARDSFTVASEQLLGDWLLVWDHILSLFWQRFFEFDRKIVVGEQEVYQADFLLTKVNRLGKLQIRSLVISTQRLYNIEVKAGSLEIGKVKWWVPLGAITKLLLFKKDPCALTIFASKSDANRDKEDATYLCRSESERHEIVSEIHRILYTRRGLTVNVEEF